MLMYRSLIFGLLVIFSINSICIFSLTTTNAYGFDPDICTGMCGDAPVIYWSIDENCQVYQDPFDPTSPELCIDPCVGSWKYLAGNCYEDNTLPTGDYCDVRDKLYDRPEIETECDWGPTPPIAIAAYSSGSNTELSSTLDNDYCTCYTTELDSIEIFPVPACHIDSNCPGITVE